MRAWEKGRGEGITPSTLPAQRDRVTSSAEDANATSPARPPITVVVCTRDRPELLAGCLAALARLRYPDHEVVVVDNASRDAATAQLVATTPFRYVREDRPGSTGPGGAARRKRVTTWSPMWTTT